MKNLIIAAAVVALLYLFYSASKQGNAKPAPGGGNLLGKIDPTIQTTYPVGQGPILVTPSTPTANATLSYVAPILRTGFQPSPLTIDTFCAPPNLCAINPSPVTVNDGLATDPNSPSQLVTMNGDPATQQYSGGGVSDVPAGTDYPGIQDYMVDPMGTYA